MVRDGGCSWRERVSVTVAAGIPAALSLLKEVIAQGGRLAWLAPALALPLGLLLCALWRPLGREDLSRGLEAAFGGFWGRAVQLLYLLWAWILLTRSARNYAARLLAFTEGTWERWLFLACALALSLWLSRGRGAVLARSGRLFLLAVAAALALALALALPGVDWKNLWPPAARELRLLPAAAGSVLSLCGWGVYALCLPCRGGERERLWPWAVGGCLGLSGLLFIVVGVFAPALVGELSDPFLTLLEGVGAPGLFRRGEALLCALFTLGDLTLLALLSFAAAALWRSLCPSLPWAAPALVGAAFLAAGAGPGPGWGAAVLPLGNLLFGLFLPALGRCTKSWRERGKS